MKLVFGFCSLAMIFASSSFAETTVKIRFYVRTLETYPIINKTTKLLDKGIRPVAPMNGELSYKFKFQDGTSADGKDTLHIYAASETSTQGNDKNYSCAATHGKAGSDGCGVLEIKKIVHGDVKSFDVPAQSFQVNGQKWGEIASNRKLKEVFCSGGKEQICTQDYEVTVVKDSSKTKSAKAGTSYGGDIPSYRDATWAGGAGAGDGDDISGPKVVPMPQAPAIGGGHQGDGISLKK